MRILSKDSSCDSTSIPLLIKKNSFGVITLLFRNSLIAFFKNSSRDLSLHSSFPQNVLIGFSRNSEVTVEAFRKKMPVTKGILRKYPYTISGRTSRGIYGATWIHYGNPQCIFPMDYLWIHACFPLVACLPIFDSKKFAISLAILTLISPRILPRNKILRNFLSDLYLEIFRPILSSWNIRKYFKRHSEVLFKEFLEVFLEFEKIMKNYPNNI